MNKSKYSLEQIYTAKYLFRSRLLIIPGAVSVGLPVALFLWLLDIATAVRLPKTSIVKCWMRQKKQAL
jgi:hypothetical protein